MFLTGFADEAASDIAGQIRATRELGWNWIESRRVGSGNIHDIPDAEFEQVVAALDGSGVGINCFGSAIANWGKHVDQPFESSLAETARAIPRMQRLGTTMVRIMSFAVRRDADNRPHPDQMEAERFRRLNELVARFRDAGITPVHENCMNYGGLGWRHTMRMLDAVPGMELVFDTGNPTHTDDGGPLLEGKPFVPGAKQSAWEFYRQVRDRVAYVHIKDGRVGADAVHVHTWPGEGSGDVRRIVADLLARGYDGGFSMEPHLAVVHHDPSITSPDAIRFANYVEYGRRFERLLAEVRAQVAGPRSGQAAGR